MGHRAEALAAQFAAVNTRLVAAIEGRPAAFWQVPCAGERWSVGTTVRHLARSYPRVMAVVGAAAAGGSVPPVTWPMIHADNARHAREHPAPDRHETLQQLRRRSEEVAQAIRALPDPALDRAIPWGLANDEPTSAVRLIAQHLINHAAEHLAGIEDAATS